MGKIRSHLPFLSTVSDLLTLLPIKVHTEFLLAINGTDH